VLAMNKPGELTLEIKRTLPATSAVVFRAFVDANELARCWGPGIEARRSLHRDGWTDSFDKLELLVSAQA
jgi:hypothetical protein